MADRHQFKTGYPAGPNMPSGELLNAYGASLNSLIGGFGGGGLGYNGLANQSTLPPGQLFGLARITDNGNSGGIIAGGEVDAPRADQNKYLIQFRYWDADNLQWSLHDTGINRLDAGAYHSGSPNIGPIPKYNVGDVVPVMFDPVKNWCVPLHSPPEEVTSYVFRAQTDVQPGVFDGAPYADGVNVCLELRRNGNWFCMLPELSIHCAGRYKAGASGSMPIVMALRHYDQLRLRCGSHPISSGDYVVYEHGLRIVPLARLVPGRTPEPGLGEMKPAYQNLTLLPNLQQVTTTRGRWKDAPHFSVYENGLRVEMGNPFDQWMVAIDYWSELRQVDADWVFIRVHHSDKSDGDLVEPIDHEGAKVHPGGLMRYEAVGDTWTLDKHAFIRFVDYQQDSFDVIAEQGRIYGPCHLVGELPGVLEGDEESGDPVPDRPLYLCTIGEQEYLCKHTSQAGTMTKGTSEELQLYDKDEQASGIFKSAKALFHDIKRGKWCIMKRLNRAWLVSQVECD